MSFSITHVITTIELGGAEKQLLEIATCQSKHGDDIKVIFLKGNPILLSEFSSAGIQVDNTLSHFSFIRQVFELRKKRHQNNNVFHAHLPRAEILCALALKSKSFVVTRHNAEPFFPGQPALFSKALSRFVLMRAQCCISISEAVKRFLLDTKEMKNSQNSVVVPYGLVIEDLVPKKLNFKASNLHKVGTVSRLVKQKNLPLLIKAIKIINESKQTPVQLSIVGSGPLQKDLELLTKELGVNHCVSWLGKTDRINEFYKTLDIFVLASDYEGFGLVLLEAMLQQVPIVARRKSAIPEVLGNNHPGLIDTDNPSELAEKIWSMLNNQELVNVCLEYQAKQVANFAIDKSIAAYRKIYLQVKIE
jgi:glycosyltransferase involved in cell wall biosynthesis